MSPAAPSLHDVWRQGARRLREAGAAEAEADAERLLMHLLGIGKAELLRDWREPFPQERAAAWEALLRRREAGEPVQYIAGEQSFYGRTFEVGPAVLIPRPETELLAEAALQALPADRPLAVLDVGTGSGALAVTLAAERPQWRAAAAALSGAALAVARRNARRHGVEDRIAFLRGDLLLPYLEAYGGEPPDAIVSNPPYIPSADLEGLQREVRDFEPHLALDGGPDGLAPYRRMAEQLRAFRALPRFVGFEVGIGQAQAVAALLRQGGGWSAVRTVRDYAGIDRHVLAVRS